MSDAASPHAGLVGTCYKETNPYVNRNGVSSWSYTLVTATKGDDQLLTDFVQFSEKGESREGHAEITPRSLSMGCIEVQPGEMQILVQFLRKYKDKSVINQCFAVPRKGGVYFARAVSLSHKGLHTLQFKNSNPQTPAEIFESIVPVSDLLVIKPVDENEFNTAVKLATAKPTTKPLPEKKTASDFVIDESELEAKSKVIKNFRFALKQRAENQGQDDIIVSEPWRVGMLVTYSRKKGFNFSSFDMLHAWDKSI